MSRSRSARDLFTAPTIRKKTGLREWVIRENLYCKGYDSELRELYSLAEARRLKLARKQEREKRRLELELLKKRGFQLCIKCGAVIKYPGAYYCADPGCWPPSWRIRLERQLAGKAARHE